MAAIKPFLSRLLLVLLGVVIGSILYAYAPALIRTADHEPPANLISVSDRIDTSGQPTPAQLAALQSRGYDLVINLAPPEVFGSIAEEGGIVGRSGIDYVNIPVDWHEPSPQDYIFFSSLIRMSSARRILVHCQVNMRASLFTFLHRVIHENADPDEAYDDVLAIWVPDPHWISFTNTVLAQSGVQFEI